MRPIRRGRHTVGVGAGELCQRGRQQGRDDGDGFKYGVLLGAVVWVDVDYVHSVGLVFGDIQARLGLIQGHLVGLAFQSDTGRYRRRSVQIHDVDLAVANAGNVCPTRRNLGGRVCGSRDHRPERIFSARYASLQGVGLAGAQVEFAEFLGGKFAHRRPVAQASGVHHDRIVVVVRYHQRLPILRNRHAGGARLHAQADARSVAYDEFGLLHPCGSAVVQSEGVDIVKAGQTRIVVSGGVWGAGVGIVAHAAGYVKSFTGRIEDNPMVRIGDRHDLLNGRCTFRNVIDEHILLRVLIVKV